MCEMEDSIPLDCTCGRDEKLSRVANGIESSVEASPSRSPRSMSSESSSSTTT